MIIIFLSHQVHMVPESCRGSIIHPPWDIVGRKDWCLEYQSFHSRQGGHLPVPRQEHLPRTDAACRRLRQDRSASRSWVLDHRINRTSILKTCVVEEIEEVEFSSVQGGVLSQNSPLLCAPPHLSEVFRRSLWNSSSVRLVSRKVTERFLFPLLTPPCDRWPKSALCLQVVSQSHRLWWLLCPPVHLLGRFPSLRHVQGSTSPGVYESWCRTLTHGSLGFPFHC